MTFLILFYIAQTPFSADKVEIIKEKGESIIHLIGNVIIEDEETRIECQDARMFENQDYVVLNTDVVITDKDGYITSQYARYHFATKQGYLVEDVRLLSGEQIISADSLYYDGARSCVEMHRNVVVEDKENDMFCYGGTGWYDLNEDIGHLIGTPRVELMREDRDPIHVHATKFVLNAQEDMFYGYDSVHAQIDSITVDCDTFAYDLTKDSGIMVTPHVIEKENVLQGEAGSFHMKNEQVESFSVFQGWSEYHSDEGNINNVTGDTITIKFEQGEAVQIIVQGDPSGVLQLKKEPDNVED